jgi:hypothetical protein
MIDGRRLLSQLAELREADRSIAIEIHFLDHAGEFLFAQAEPPHDVLQFRGRDAIAVVLIEDAERKLQPALAVALLGDHQGLELLKIHGS